MQGIRAVAAILVTLLLLSGCAPVISEERLKARDPELTFSRLLEGPEKHVGSTVVLGGAVIGIETMEGKTVMEVLQAPLGTRLRPKPDKSEGRFLVEFDGFLDPVIYRGKLITAAGKVKGAETRLLGKMPYRYPVIKSEESHFWRPEEGRVGIGIGLGIILTD